MKDAELLMMLFANTQLNIELMDELPNTSFFNQSYKTLSNKYLKENEDKINRLFKLMSEKGEDGKHMQTAFQQSTDALELFYDAIKNNTIETMIVFLKALKDGEILQAEQGKHKKILSQLKPVEI